MEVTALLGVETTVPDEVVSVLDPAPTSPPEAEIAAPVKPNGSCFWGLDRTKQQAVLLDSSIAQCCFPKNGLGVTVYVLDSGISVGHPQFGGRATSAVATGLPHATGAHCFGHGSHVAGTVGGATAGAAPHATIVGVKCFSTQGAVQIVDVVATMD